jgi:hypothetical protein
VAEYLEGQLPVLEELVGDQCRHLGEEGDEREVGEQDHGLLVVAASDGRVLHLPEVGEPEQEVVVQLERRQAAPVVVRMQRGNGLWTKLMASSPSAEKKRRYGIEGNFSNSASPSNRKKDTLPYVANPDVSKNQCCGSINISFESRSTVILIYGSG